MELDNFIIDKTKERRGEERGDLAKKSNSCLANIEQQLMVKIAKNSSIGLIISIKSMNY